jgi:hypothetical protein
MYPQEVKRKMSGLLLPALGTTDDDESKNETEFFKQCVGSFDALSFSDEEDDVQVPRVQVLAAEHVSSFDTIHRNDSPAAEPIGLKFIIAADDRLESRDAFCEADIRRDGYPLSAIVRLHSSATISSSFQPFRLQKWEGKMIGPRNLEDLPCPCCSQPRGIQSSVGYRSTLNEPKIHLTHRLDTLQGIRTNRFRFSEKSLLELMDNDDDDDDGDDIVVNGDYCVAIDHSNVHNPNSATNVLRSEKSAISPRTRTRAEKLIENEEGDLQRHILPNGQLYTVRKILVEGWLHKKGTGSDWMGSRGWKPRWARLASAHVDGCHVDVPILLVSWFRSSSSPSTGASKVGTIGHFFSSTVSILTFIPCYIIAIVLDSTVVLSVNAANTTKWNHARFEIRNASTQSNATIPVARIFSAPVEMRNAWVYAISLALLNYEKDRCRYRDRLASKQRQNTKYTLNEQLTCDYARSVSARPPSPPTAAQAMQTLDRDQLMHSNCTLRPLSSQNGNTATDSPQRSRSLNRGRSNQWGDSSLPPRHTSPRPRTLSPPNSLHFSD